MGEEKIKQFDNFCLRYLADLELPKKRYIGQYVRTQHRVMGYCDKLLEFTPE